MILGDLSNSLLPVDDPNLKPPDPLVLEYSVNTPPLVLVEALAAREPKDLKFFPDPDNIGV